MNFEVIEIGPERIGYIEEIAVLERARGEGIGRALMRAACEHLAALGIETYKLSTVPGNDAARAFYSRLGQRPAARLMIGRTCDDGLAGATPGDG